MTARSHVSAAALVVTEVYPPAPGGSGELMHNIYSRCGLRTTVLTQSTAPGPSVTVEGDVHVIREEMKAADWGIANGSALRHHLSRAARLRALSADAPTILHCSGALPEGLDAWLARIGRRLPYLCWAHGEELNVFDSSRELRFLFQRVQRRADAVIANSANTASLLRARGVDAAKLHVVRPCVDADRFRPGVPGGAALRASLAPEGTVIVLTVGRLQERKGHDLVLRALATLGPDAPPIRYVIVGSGAGRDRLEQLARDLGVTDSVVFAGAVPFDRLPAYYAAADIFVHPNRVERGDFEGFGIVFLEAAAAGLPIIGGDSGGVPEAVERDVTGLLVSGSDVEELRRDLLVLCADAGRRRAMGDAGRRRAVREFNWSTAAARVAEIHASIAGARF